MKLSALTTCFLTVSSVILSTGLANAQTGSDKKHLDTIVMASAAHGQVITTAVNSYMSPNSGNSFRVLQPFNLVYFAYQGNLKSQGIPSGSSLIFQHQKGNLKAKDLVKAAIDANKLPSQILQDQTYLSAVDVQLTSFQSTLLH